MSNLLVTVMEYLKENLVLTIILAVVLLLIIAIVIAMVVLSAQHKKQTAAVERVQTEEEPLLWEIEEDEPYATVQNEEAPDRQTVIPLPAPSQEEPEAKEAAPETEPVIWEEADEEPEEEPESNEPAFAGTIFEETSPEEREEPEKEQETAMEKKKTEAKKKPVKKTVTEKKAEPAKKAAPAKKTEAVKKAEPAKKAEAVKKAEPVKKTEAVKKAEPAKKAPVKKAEPAKKAETAKSDPYSGKWVIKVNKKGNYYFALYASNGEKMLTSGDYASASSAKSGIETYKKNIESGRFNLVQTKKSKDYIFQLLNANGKLMAIGADYKTRERCEDAIESTKRFAKTARIEDTTKKS